MSWRNTLNNLFGNNNEQDKKNLPPGQVETQEEVANTSETTDDLLWGTLRDTLREDLIWNPTKREQQPNSHQGDKNIQDIKKS
jgi:hypothetical protein